MNEQSYEPNENALLPKLNLFSFTLNTNKRENIDSSHRGPAPIDINSPFKPRRQARINPNAKRAIIFPSLQSLQRSTLQKQDPKPTPFFNLLKPNLPTRASTPSSITGHNHPKIVCTPCDGTKIEPLSDLELSSPLPPSKSPIQILPPSLPPIGPISRPGSRFGSRCRSASSASASLSRDETSPNPPDYGASTSTGLPDIAINALRELQAITMELNDQRRQTQSLLTQLNSLSLTHDELKTTHDHLIQKINAMKQHLLAAQNDLASERELASNSNLAISTVKDELASSRRELEFTQGELRSSQGIVEQLRAGANDARAGLALEREDVKKRFDKAQKGLTEMSNSYKELHAKFESLQISHQNTQDLLQEMRLARLAAADGLRVLEPLLEQGGSCSRASEVSLLVTELQGAIADSQRVNDLLRDKLHHQSSQLAQANERIRELEQDERVRLGELIGVLSCERGDTCGRSAELLGKVECLSAKLIKREEEAIGVLAEAAGLETKLCLVNSALEDARKALEDSRVEVNSLRDVQEEKRTLETRLNSLVANFTNQRDALHTALAELNDAQGCNQENTAAIISLKNDIKILEHEKLMSNTMLCEVQAARDQLERKLAAETARNGISEVEIDRMRQRDIDHEAKLRDVSSSMAALQERFDAQSITLRLAKEHCGDIQDSCTKAQDALATEITKEISLRARVELLEDELVKVHAGSKNTRDIEISKGAAAQARVEALEAELAKLGKERVDHETLLRETQKRVEEELVKAREDGVSREEKFRQEQNRVMLLQDRYDAQVATLRATKENSTALQERLTLAEISFATKLASATGRLETEIAILKERNSAIQQTLDDAEASTRQAAFVAASVEFEKKLAKQEYLSDQLIQVERSRSEFLEREAIDAKRMVTEIKGHIGGLQEQLRRITERGEGVEVEKIMLLKCKVEELEGVNNDLILRAGNLKERYSSGDLSDNEKDFVDFLMKLSYTLHEQEDVAKDNELRRRENMINTLQGIIRDLESSLARLLREKEVEGGGVIKSMVDLTLWPTSSPITPDEKGPIPQQKIQSSELEDNLKPPVPSPNNLTAPDGPTETTPSPIIPCLPGPSNLYTIKTSAPAKSRARIKPQVEILKSTPHPKPQGTFSTLALDSEEEEDVPLSEISDISTVLGKRDRIPSPDKENLKGTRSRRTVTQKVSSVNLSQQGTTISQKKPADPKSKKKRK